MGGRPWTAGEERRLASMAGLVPVARIASILGRTEDGVRTRAKELRAQGRMSSQLRVPDIIEYTSDLMECPSCLKMRSKFGDDGECDVCRMQKRLERYQMEAEKAYWNMPKELRDRSECRFSVERRADLMSKKRLSRPKPPNTKGMDAFWAAKAMDDHARAEEAYEYEQASLDVDAMKQRKSKWLRKARKWREEHR